MDGHLPARPLRDLKEGSGLSRCPSGQFFANGAWLACCVLAHNLMRWVARLGRVHPARQLTVAATIRNRLLAVPARLVNHSGRRKLRLPSRWPWAAALTTALAHTRNLPQLMCTSPQPRPHTPQNAPARTHAPAQRPTDPNRRSHKPVGGFRLRHLRRRARHRRSDAKLVRSPSPRRRRL